MEPELIATLENFETEFVELGTYLLYKGQYYDGNTAIMASTEYGEPAFVLSVNMDTPLEEGEFWVKDWSENEGIPGHLILRGIIEATGDVAPAGFAIARGARLTEQYR